MVDTRLRALFLCGYDKRLGKADENGEFMPCRAGLDLFCIDSMGGISIWNDRMEDECGNTPEEGLCHVGRRP